MCRILRSFAVCILISANSAHAGTILFDLQAERLKDNLGNAMSVNGLVLLVADTSQNGFSAISDGSTLALNAFLNGGDDRVLARFDLSANATPGFLFENPSITYGSGWDIGDPLALLWFPTLTLASSSAAGGVNYGSFSGPPLNASQSWITPADGTSGHKLYFNTADAAIIPGSHVAGLGNASLTVVAIPEPSRSLLGLIGLGVLALRRRRC